MFGGDGRQRETPARRPREQAGDVNTLQQTDVLRPSGAYRAEPGHVALDAALLNINCIPELVAACRLPPCAE